MEFRKIYDTIPEKFERWRPKYCDEAFECIVEKANIDSIVNGDFEKYELQENHYDLVYSAATIQWIPEEIGFPKIYKLLKKGAYPAMMFMVGDFQAESLMRMTSLNISEHTVIT